MFGGYVRHNAANKHYFSYREKRGVHATHRRSYRLSKQRYFGQWDRTYSSRFLPTTAISHQNNRAFERVETHPMCTRQTDDGSFEIARAFYGSNQSLFTFFTRGRDDDLGCVLRLGRATPLYEGALRWRWRCASFRHGALSFQYSGRRSWMSGALV